MTAIRALLERLIDYAGLFPPAALDMKTAVRNYSAYRESDDAWALGRFVVTAQSLSEFTTAFDEACCGEQASPWLLSVLSTGDAAGDERLISEFSEGAAFLDAIEGKVSDATQIESLLASVPSGMLAYVEFNPEQSEQILPILKKNDARAKIRTGGITAEAIPSVEQLGRFLVASAKEKVAFKATAGLHHPIRSEQKLTYDADSASAIMHGFINLFVAATIAYGGAGIKDVIDVIEEKNPTAFQWDKKALSWRNYRLSAKQIAEVRKNFAISFGSCSFTEPIGDLKALEWL
jgi:hypothetical protein